jgi:hypothetical protein
VAKGAAASKEQLEMRRTPSVPRRQMSSATNHAERAVASTARVPIADERKDRGRDAHTPTVVPVRGWKDVFVSVKDESKRDHAVLLASGVASFGLLAMVPALLALLSTYGLAGRSRSDRQATRRLAGRGPQEVRNLISQQIKDFGDASSGRRGAEDHAQQGSREKGCVAEGTLVLVRVRTGDPERSGTGDSRRQPGRCRPEGRGQAARDRAHTRSRGTPPQRANEMPATFGVISVDRDGVVP